MLKKKQVYIDFHFPKSIYSQSCRHISIVAKVRKQAKVLQTEIQRKRQRMRCNEVHLNCGIKMPLIGFGTYSFPNDKKKTEFAVQNALQVLSYSALKTTIPLDIFCLLYV